MVAEPLTFHASPPPGEWLNDPNALVHVDGLFTLFAQHRGDAPAFRATGWARFTSPDLLRWHDCGTAIPPQGARWAYSGCITVGDRGEWTAFHTEHEAGVECQVRRTSIDQGTTWSAAQPLVGLEPARANCRDPYVFERGGRQLMLLAEPCDWTDWPAQPPSILSLYALSAGQDWAAVGTIGPWQPPGIMWEVPLCVAVGDRDVLIVSEVDRRGGQADCCVRAWTGRLTGTGFERDPGHDAGQLLDYGPEFYAMMHSAADGWPDADQAFVGWASNWNIARAAPWPGFSGGPISLPRALSIVGRRIAVDPLPFVAAQFITPATAPTTAGLYRVHLPDAPVSVSVRKGTATLTIDIDPVARRARFRRAASTVIPAAERQADLVRQPATALLIFVDGPLVEIFVGGVAATFMLDGTGPVGVDCAADACFIQCLTL